MADRFEFTHQEKAASLLLYSTLKEKIGPSLLPDDEKKIRGHLADSVKQNLIKRDVFGLNPVLLGFQTAMIVVDEIGLKRDAVLAILLHPSVSNGYVSIDEVREQFGDSVARILHGLERIADLYAKNPVIESENFRNLLLSFAETCG